MPMVDFIDVCVSPEEKEEKGHFSKTTEREMTGWFQGYTFKLIAVTSNTQDDYTGKKNIKCYVVCFGPLTWLLSQFSRFPV